MKWKRSVITALTMVLALTGAACSSRPSASEMPKEPEQQQSQGQGQGSDGEAKGEKMTISGIRYRFGDPPPSDGPGLKMINERFNIDYKPIFVVNTAFDEKINATFASGEIPDITVLMGSDLKVRYNKFAKQGAFLPLDDYIDQYPTLKVVPDFIWESMKVNGKIYAIPHYSPKYQVVTVIRKDWLDALGLPVPTTYEELAKVAIAFTKDDPDKNNKNDTYGIAIGKDINPNFNQGPYWDPDAWYHKNGDGDFIPGLIGPGRKEIVAMLAELNKQGAITKDYAVLNWADTNKEFYSGKAGIFIGTPRGMSQEYMDGLLAIQPNAAFIHLAPFVDEYGNQGLTSGNGYSGLTVLNAKLAQDPDKLHRIFEFLDFGRTFYSQAEKNDKNPDFDWWSGKVGVAYDMVDGVPVNKDNWASDGLAPSTYFMDNAQWAPNDTDIDYSLTYQTKPLSELVAGIEQMYKGTKLFANPINGLESPTFLEKGEELRQYVMNEQVKMIAGQRPISDWDKLVQEYMDRGGAQIIKEYNEGIRDKDAANYFK